jgi:hypothetical protein
LVTALDRAFALAEMDKIAVLVAQHLDFDVAWINNELFSMKTGHRQTRISLPSGRSSPLRPPLWNAQSACLLPPPPADALIITG